MKDPINHPVPVADLYDDAKYCAAAMNAVPAMLEEIDRLRVEVEELRKPQELRDREVQDAKIQAMRAGIWEPDTIDRKFAKSPALAAPYQLFTLDIAQGEELDRIAALYNLTRKNLETDVELRNRTLASARQPIDPYHGFVTAPGVGEQLTGGGLIHPETGEVTRIELDLPTCDCGAIKAQSTHARWCQLNV